MAQAGVNPGRPIAAEGRGLFLRACFVFLAAASAALACAFYFRGPFPNGDYNLYAVTDPDFRMNDYAPADASSVLEFPRLPQFACLCGGLVLLGWVGVARRIARRDGVPFRNGLVRSAVVSYPLIALLAVPAHHVVGLPLTIAPVFLMIVCIALGVAIGGYLLRPSFGGRVAGALFSVWSVWALSAVWTVIFSVLILREYHALHLGYHDSGMYGEAVWNASRGGALHSNWPETGLAIQWHCELILVPLAWLYRLWPHHEMLLLVQSVGVGLGAVPVYLIARSVLNNSFAAWCLAAAYLLAPSTAFVALPSTYGFRPLTLLVPTLLWAIAFLERRSVLWYALFLLLAIVVKEEAAPVLVMLGIFIAARHRRWWLAAATVALGVGWFFLATRVILPIALDRPYRFPTHLEQLGSSAGEVIGTALSRPLATARTVFSELQKAFFLLHLLVPVLLLPLLSPTAALVGAASFVILTLATWYGKYTILLGAQAPVLPGLYLAAAYGLKNFAGRETWLLRRLLPARLFGDRERVLRAAGLGVLAAAALSQFLFFFRIMPWARFEVTDHARLVTELRRRIPRNASLCASYRLATHFTDQRDLYLAPTNLTGADYVALDLYDEWAGVPTMASYRNRLLRAPDFGPLYARDGFLIFQRGAPHGLLDAAYRLKAAPHPQYAQGAQLGGFASLLGYDAKLTPAGLDLTLYWRCDAATTTDYAVGLVFGDGRPGKHQPMAWRYLPCDGVLPTWAWKPGDLIADRLTVPDLFATPSGPPRIAGASLEPIEPPE